MGLSEKDGEQPEREWSKWHTFDWNGLQAWRRTTKDGELEERTLVDPN